jgi:outer membrane protein assembly factor BamE (lipoprotein component of BamABCDE complex)
MKRLVTILCFAAAAGCTTAARPGEPRDRDGDRDIVNVARLAYQTAETNRTRVNTIRLGQTLVEVQRIMGPPERRAARLRYDGVSIEEWSYITDYVRKMDALILFVGGKVQEIQSTPWDERIPDEKSGTAGRGRD